MGRRITILSFLFFRLWNFDERTGMKMEMEMERKRMLSRVSRPNNKVGHERGRKRRRRRRSWLRRNTRDGLWSLITRVKYRLSNWFCSFPSYERAIPRQCIAIVARPSVILLWNDTRNIWERKRKKGERKIKLLLSSSCDRYIINPRNIMFLLRVLSQFKITCVNKMLQINEIFAFHTFPKEREGRGKISILPKATILTNWSQLMELIP